MSQPGTFRTGGVLLCRRRSHLPTVTTRNVPDRECAHGGGWLVSLLGHNPERSGQGVCHRPSAQPQSAGCHNPERSGQGVCLSSQNTVISPNVTTRNVPDRGCAPKRSRRSLRKSHNPERSGQGVCPVLWGGKSDTLSQPGTFRTGGVPPLPQRAGGAPGHNPERSGQGVCLQKPTQLRWVEVTTRNVPDRGCALRFMPGDDPSWSQPGTFRTGGVPYVFFCWWNSQVTTRNVPDRGCAPARSKAFWPKEVKAVF